MRMAIGIAGLIAWIVSGAVLFAVMAKIIEVPSWVVVLLAFGEGAGLLVFAWWVAEGDPPDSGKR